MAPYDGQTTSGVTNYGCLQRSLKKDIRVKVMSVGDDESKEESRLWAPKAEMTRVEMFEHQVARPTTGVCTLGKK